MIKLATSQPIDKLLDGGVEVGAITNFYGPPGSGKTNIALCAALNCLSSGKSLIYMDTEGSFSLERFRQLGGNELGNIIFMEPHTWKEQHEMIRKLEKVVERDSIGLIIIDSLVALYRLELDRENFQLVNRQLATQYSLLSKIARKYKMPVVVTNQVYGYRDFGEEKIELTSRAIAKYWSKALIELKRGDRPNHRIAIVRKHRSIPESKSIEFEITRDGLKGIGKFSIL